MSRAAEIDPIVRERLVCPTDHGPLLDAGDELYNLREDPHCLRNVAEDPRYRAIMEEMCVRMWRRGYQEDDIFCNPYPTVSLAPYGPMSGLRGL